MLTIPCLCGCGGSGYGHRCRTPFEFRPPPDADDRRQCYDAFNDKLNAELHRLMATNSPPRRTSDYALFVRGCLEFEPPTPGISDCLSDSETSLTPTTESDSLRVITPEEDHHAMFDPVIVSSALSDEFHDDATSHNIAIRKSIEMPDMYDASLLAASLASRRSSHARRRENSDPYRIQKKRRPARRSKQTKRGNQRYTHKISS